MWLFLIFFILKVFSLAHSFFFLKIKVNVPPTCIVWIHCCWQWHSKKILPTKILFHFYYNNLIVYYVAEAKAKTVIMALLSWWRGVSSKRFVCANAKNDLVTTTTTTKATAQLAYMSLLSLDGKLIQMETKAYSATCIRMSDAVIVWIFRIIICPMSFRILSIYR